MAIETNAEETRRTRVTWRTELPLEGAGREPVDLARTIHSHGLASLPPARVEGELLEVTISTSGGPRTITLRPVDAALAAIEGSGSAPAPLRAEVVAKVAHLLRLDEDLSDFYATIRDDPDLSWVASGAGRMMRSESVFEDVVKTICTTNCSWAATVRMVGALVEHLGDPAPDAPAEGPFGRLFPSPAAMADADETFYRDVVRAGYRGAYLRSLATAVAAGDLDLESLGRASFEEIPDEHLEEYLLALPGVGPYAAAHIMLMLGRYSRLILDSWTRPTFLRVSGMRRAKDTTILRRFRRYGRYAGLAFWLYLTRGWLPLEPEGLRDEVSETTP